MPSSEPNSSLKIAFFGSEAVPYAKTGGLGDVVGDLARGLARRGHDVALFLPFYADSARNLPPIAPIIRFEIATPLKRHSVSIRPHHDADGVRVFFIDEPELFDRPGIYVDQNKTSFADNDLRFSLFCRASLEAIERLKIPVDVLHTHDWPTGLIPVYAKTLYRDRPSIARAATVHTIHNLEFQGRFPKDRFPITSLPDDLYTMDGIEFWNDWSMLKGGLLFADRLTTVSPTYAIEIRAPEEGRGLEGVIRHRAEKLTGIVNGIDTEKWNPRTDPNLARQYDAATWQAGKAACKETLQQSLGLPKNSDIPLVGMVGRVTLQKGFDILGAIAKNLLNMEIQFVLVGTGDPAIEEMLRQFGACYPDRVAIKLTFDETLARRVYAGSDWFLMPSRSEPCGLSQLLALRYGSIPIVHAVGGLLDTVRDATPANLELGRATGFHFQELTPAAVLGALARAKDAFHSPAIWKQLVTQAMNQDWSWPKSAERYEEVYRLAIMEHDRR